MKQWGRIVVILCLLILGLTACRPLPEADVQSAESPQHIVSLGVSNDEMLLELVDTNRIAAISAMPSNLPEAAARVSGRATTSLESVVAYQPDLFIGSEWMSADFIAQVNAAGIRVHLVNTPRSIAEMRQEIRTLGEILHVPQEAAQMNAKIDASLQHIQQIVREGIDRGIPAPRVAYYSNMGITGGIGSLFDALCREMQMTNVAAEAGLRDGEVLSKEQLVALAPDFIVISGSEYDQDNYQAIDAASLLGDPSLQTVPAVVNRRICVVDARHLLSLNRFILVAGEEIAAYWYAGQGD